jgi:hypothetical protein
VLVWRAFGTPRLDLADLANIDAHQKPWKDNETFGEWRDSVVDTVPEGARDQAIRRLAVLDPTGKKEPEDVLDQSYWDKARSSQPRAEEVRRERATFLADLAAWEIHCPTSPAAWFEIWSHGSSWMRAG